MAMRVSIAQESKLIELDKQFQMRDAKVKISSDRNQCKNVKNLQESAEHNVKKKT